MIVILTDLPYPDEIITRRRVIPISVQRSNEEKDTAGFFITLILLTLTVSSFLVFPSIQGTTIAVVLLPIYLISLVYKHSHQLAKVINQAIIFLVCFSTIQFIAVFSTYISYPDDWLVDSNMILVNQQEITSGFKSSIITQSIYLFSGVLLFFVCKIFVTEQWHKIAVLGAAASSVFGLLEIVASLATGDSVQWFHNRIFFNSEISTRSIYTPTITILGFSIQRLNGLSVEPSMFALTVVPFLFFSYKRNMIKSTFIIFVALFMTFSTTAYFGLALFLALFFFEIKNRSFFSKFFVVLSSILVLILSFGVLSSIFNALFYSKFTKSSISGYERSTNATTTLNFFLDDFSIFQKVFGIGFGTVRSTDFISTLLVNSGILGLIVFLFLFTYPLFSKSFSLSKDVQFVIVFLLPAILLAVPEFSILSLWYFLGSAYTHKKKVASSLDWKRENE
jgi:hypothetical protein